MAFTQAEMDGYVAAMERLGLLKELQVPKTVQEACDDLVEAVLRVNPEFTFERFETLFREFFRVASNN